MASVQTVTTNTVTHTTGYTHHRERGPDVRRVNVNYEYVMEPVIIPRPRIEDFNSLVVVHNKMEYYS
ncbi:MAG: hypothetical protein FWG71_01890 [Synergistaceae bacterium]|nr:hypothetical protein [Synergistaceae bacterium]